MTAEVYPVDPADVAALLDGSIVPSARTLTLAGSAVAVITGLARGYTRGRGFAGGDPTEQDVAAVITTAAARLAANTAQLPTSRTTDDRTIDVRGAFSGWTLAEQIVLNRYRVRAQ